MVNQTFKNGTFLFPTDELINSIPKEFKVWNDLVFIKKKYTIGYIQTAIHSTYKYKTLVIATNDKELYGFIAKHNPKTLKFNYIPFTHHEINNFLHSVLLCTQQCHMKCDEKEILEICQEVKTKACQMKEKNLLEISLDVNKITPIKRVKL